MESITSTANTSSVSFMQRARKTAMISTITQANRNSTREGTVLWGKEEHEEEKEELW